MWQRVTTLCCVLCCTPSTSIGALSGPLRESWTRCPPDSGLQRAERAKESWRPPKGLRRSIEGRSALGGQMWTEIDSVDVERFVRDHLNRPIEQLIPVLAEALASASPGTRGGALSVITARCGFPAMLASPLKENYPTDMARLRELAPTVEPLLAAAHEHVRHEAVKAYACLTSTPEETGWRMANGTIARFLERYLNETSPAIRSEITKTFALSTNDTPEIRAHLLTLLKSTNAAERSQAEIALRRFFPRERISDLVACISDSNVWMRYACSIALSFYPDEAVPHLAKLEAALKAEPNDDTRRQLQRTVDLLRRWPKG